MLEKFKDDYPFNLIIEVYRQHQSTLNHTASKKDPLIIQKIYDVDYNELNDAINRLDIRQRKCIKLRFEDKLTLKKVGHQLDNIQAERARQIIAKTIRELKRILFDKKTTTIKTSHLNKLTESNTILNRKNNELLNILYNNQLDINREIIKLKTNNTTHLINIADLNLGTYTENKLMQQNINTLEDLIKFNYHDLKSLNGIGRTSIDNIHKELRDTYGVNIHLL